MNWHAIFTSENVAKAVVLYIFWALFAIIVAGRTDFSKRPGRAHEFLIITGLGPWCIFFEICEKIARWLFDPATRK